jgi:hypothetical protein
MAHGLLLSSSAAVRSVIFLIVDTLDICYVGIAPECWLPLTDLNKHGEFEKLKFPVFHKELLSQSYWNAGDDFGRIKVVIAEGFSREHLAYPFDRTKNIVSFSFQHAPIGKILLIVNFRPSHCDTSLVLISI